MTTDKTEGLSARLREACVGHPHARIEWPHRILHEAADTLDAMAAALKDLLNATDPYAKSPRRDDVGEIDARGRAVKVLHAAGYTTTTDDLRAAEAAS